MTAPLNLYVGCGLTLAPERFKNDVTELKRQLAGSYNILEFLGLIQGTNLEVYQHDMNCVRKADLFIAVCDFPSTGLGVELERARQLEKPTLAVAHSGSLVTRLVLGMAEDEPTMHFAIYENMVSDIPKLAEVHLSPLLT